MYISIGSKENGRGVEISYLGEWIDDSYTDHAVAGIDIIVKLGYSLHLLAAALCDNHVAICILNFQVVLFFKN